MKNLLTKLGWTVVAVALAGALVSCGGGGSSITPPPPVPLTITSASLPGSFYGEFYSATLQSSGGTGAKTWTVSSGTLPSGLNLDHTNGVISGVLTFEGTGPSNFSITVRDAATNVATKNFTVTQDQRAAAILTTTLPDAVIGRPYRVRLATTQPNNLITFDLTQGVPPPWLNIGAQQTLLGQPTVPTVGFTFVVQLIPTSGAPVQRRFTLNVVGQGAANRNDDIADARTLSNGTYFASISPLTDPVTAAVATPDNDYYRFTAQPGSTVSVQIFAARDSSPMDSVIELLDSAGARLNTCDSPGESGFTSPCLDDDNVEEDEESPARLDSKLTFRAPAGAPTSIFLHVVDWRGDARPDMLYQFQIFGVD
jgi:Putative Ig domain